MTEERTPMEWTERVGPFTATVDAVAGIVDDIVESGRPGLGEWDLGTLAHHTFRAVTTRQRYLAAATTQGRRELPDAAGYLAVYLDRRAADPERMDRTVAQRARDEAHPMPALAAAFRQAAT